MSKVDIMCEILIFLKNNPDSTTREILEMIEVFKNEALDCLNILDKKGLVEKKWQEGEVPYIDMPTWRLK